MTTRMRICLVTAGGHHPSIIANALGEAFGPIHVVHESPEGKLAFLKRRLRLSGPISTFGQFATMMLVVAMKKLFAGRIRRRVHRLGAEVDLRPEHAVHDVPSVNSARFVELIHRLSPDVVLLCGCRMMRADVISQIGAPLLNYHAGITPMYRGMNGGYWALAQDDSENFGTTVHLVDAGVDTGAVVGQVRLAPSAGDTIWTYPYRQAVASRKLCVECVRLVAEGALQPWVAEGPSRQWFHPAIWTYLWNGVRKGVW